MANFIERQDRLREDLKSFLRVNFDGNKAKLSKALGINPKVLRDFINLERTMQAAKYDKIIEILRKDFSFSLGHMDIGKCVHVLDGVDLSKNKVEMLGDFSYSPLSNERAKLMKYFLDGGHVNDIKNFTLLTDNYGDPDHESHFLKSEKLDGFIPTLNKDYKDFFEKHDALANYKYLLDELNNEHGCYFYGHRVPIYFLNENDDPQAVIQFTQHEKAARIKKKVSAVGGDYSKLILESEEVEYCERNSYDFAADAFRRKFNDFLDVAKMSKK